jgi:hypothetical protein
MINKDDKINEENHKALIEKISFYLNLLLPKEKVECMSLLRKVSIYFQSSILLFFVSILLLIEQIIKFRWKKIPYVFLILKQIDNTLKEHLDF